MRVPKYEPQVGTPTPPSVRMGSAPNEEAFGAGIGDALQKAGAKLASIAARQQEEADRAEFMLMSAQADAFAEETYANEANNPDYEGTINRFQETFRKYGEGYMQRVPDRLKQKAEQLLEMKRLSYEGKFKGLFLAKQSDAIKSGYMKIYDTLVKGNNKEELAKAVSTFSKYSAQERERLIQAGSDQIDKQVKDLQYDELVGIFTKNPWAKVDKGKYPLFDNRDWDKIDRFRRGEITQRRVEANLAKAQRKEEVMNSIYSSYGSASSMQEFRPSINKALANGDINAMEYDKLEAAFQAKLFGIYGERVYGADIQSNVEDIGKVGEGMGLSQEQILKGQEVFKSRREEKFQDVASNVGPEQDPEKALEFWGATPEEKAKARTYWSGIYNKEHSEQYNDNFNQMSSDIASGMYDGNPMKFVMDMGGKFNKEDTASLKKALDMRISPEKRDDLSFLKGVGSDIAKSISDAIIAKHGKKPESLAKASTAESRFWRGYNMIMARAGGMGQTDTTELVRQFHELRKTVIVGEKLSWGFKSDVSIPQYDMDYLTSREAGLGWRFDRKTGYLVRMHRGKTVIFTNSTEDWEPPK